MTSVHKCIQRQWPFWWQSWLCVHGTKPTFEHGQLSDASNPYMKYGRKLVINGSIIVSTKVDG